MVDIVRCVPDDYPYTKKNTKRNGEKRRREKKERKEWREAKKGEKKEVKEVEFNVKLVILNIYHSNRSYKNKRTHKEESHRSFEGSRGEEKINAT